MSFWLSLFPIVLILVLMLAFRWGTVRAGVAGYLATVVIAVLAFGAGPSLLAYVHGKALFLALDVLLIIWAAFLLYRVADEAGAIRTIGQALPHLTADPGMLALLVGWVFASFLQGVGGFGVPVAVAAPLLVGLGFAPLDAVVIPTIAHGWSVTFGSLASSFQALIAATGVPGEVLAPPTALILGLSAPLAGLLVAHAAGGHSALRRLGVPALFLGAVMGAVQYLAAVAGLWTIAAFLGSLAGLVVAIPLARRLRGAAVDNGKLDLRALLIALSGYFLLVVITLGVQLIPPVKAFLGQVVWQVNFPELRTSLGVVTPAGPGRAIPVFRHAGLLLTYSSLLAYWIYRRAGLYRPGAMGRILKGTAGRVGPASLGITAMVTMAAIMEHAGMTDALAQGLAHSMGAAYPLIAPWMGALGAFMTGSNTNSNVVFGALQLRTADLLGLPVAAILAAQTAGAGLASVMAPAKVLVGTSTVGLSGQEGEVMRRIAGYTLVSLLLVCGLTLWLVAG